MTTAGRPCMRASAKWRSATVSTRGWRTVTNGWSGNCASTAATTRVAVSPVASETTWTSTTGAGSAFTSVVSPHERAQGIPGRSDDREGRGAVAAAGVRLPLLGYLRRPRLLVRLRALRRAAETERQAG